MERTMPYEGMTGRIRAGSLAATAVAAMSIAAGGFVGCGGKDATGNDGISDASATDRSVVDSFVPDTAAPDTSSHYEASGPDDADVPDGSSPETGAPGFPPDNPCPAPTFSPPPGKIPLNQNIVITAPGLPSPTDNPPGYIFFTTDGRLPTRTSQKYDAGDAGIPIFQDTTFTAFASTLGATCVDSALSVGQYTATVPDAGMP